MDAPSSAVMAGTGYTKVTACDRDTGGTISTFKDNTTQRNLDRGSCLVLGKCGMGCGKTEPIHRARCGHAEAQMPDAACILERDQGTCEMYFETCRCHG